jgi:hypothetical protein
MAINWAIQNTLVARHIEMTYLNLNM